MSTTHAPTKITAHVSFQPLADGSVNITATGRNGTLTIHIDGGEGGPSLDIPIPDHERDPSKPYRYRAVWGLDANGHLSGWIADDEGKKTFFPALPESLTRKRPARGRQTNKD